MNFSTYLMTQNRKLSVRTTIVIVLAVVLFGLYGVDVEAINQWAPKSNFLVELLNYLVVLTGSVVVAMYIDWIVGAIFSFLFGANRR